MASESVATPQYVNRWAQGPNADPVPFKEWEKDTAEAEQHGFERGKAYAESLFPERLAASRADALQECKEYDLFLNGGDEVITITLNRKSHGFPACREQVDSLRSMIHGLGVAVKSAIYQAENDTTKEAIEFFFPIAAINDTIILLSQLSAAIQAEVSAKN